MRPLVDVERLECFLRALGRIADVPVRAYLVGGCVALLRGWRESTVDIDLRLEPEANSLLKAIPALKEELSVSVEFASPLDFLPELPGWRERSGFLRQEGKLAVFEFDFYSQALAKIERGFEQDLSDVAHMFRAGAIIPAELRQLLRRIEPQLVRFPSVNPLALWEDVERAVLESAIESRR